MLLLFFIAVDAHAQEECDEESCCYEESSSYEDACYSEGECCYEAPCCSEERCCRNFYAKILGGANFLQNTSTEGNRSTYKTGYVVAGSLGFCWRYGLHVEAEYAFRRNNIKEIHFLGEGSSSHGHFQTSSYMANLLWDVPLSLFRCACGKGQPFIGAGIGYDCQQMRSSTSRILFNQKWHHFSWQVMAGLAYPIRCNTEMTLEYKFHQGGSHFNNHSIAVGLIYKWGDL